MDESAARRRATYQDLLALPEGVTGEILNGELWTQPRPSVSHVAVASGFGHEIGSPFQSGKGGPGGWWILTEPEVHLASDVVVPDLAGWRRERLPSLPVAAALTLAPDWACEILSPSTGRKDRMIKLPLYARHGVKYVWLADPVATIIEVFRQAEGQWVLEGTFGGMECARIPPFESVELDLKLIWPHPAPNG
jgi:Uma2 family endonuclease